MKYSTKVTWTTFLVLILTITVHTGFYCIEIEQLGHSQSPFSFCVTCKKVIWNDIWRWCNNNLNFLLNYSFNTSEGLQSMWQMKKKSMTICELYYPASSRSKRSYLAACFWACSDMASEDAMASFSLPLAPAGWHIKTE